ncbi:MAG: STAS-like domain-containing protein [Deltaproteobacteria bacterium]|nr:STAS-like domain-containing protein [Deltaproteobacteria bacterium]
MKISLCKFGEILISRPSGREALAVMRAYQKPADDKEKIELDFTGVKVMAPSWLEEVLVGLREMYGDRVVCLPSRNPSVVESLKAIEE